MAIGDLFRARHKHSDPGVRAEAVRQLGDDDRELLLDIAKNDDDAEVRRLAIERIDDAGALLELAERDAAARARAASLLVSAVLGAADDSAAREAVARLAATGDQNGLGEVARKATEGTVRQAAAKHIDDPAVLAELVRKSGDEAVMRQALGRIDDVELLRGLAVSASKSVGLAALERIDDKEVIEQVADKSKHKAVRRRARQRLSAEQAQAQLDPARLAHAERVQLTRRVEKLAGTEDYRRAHEVEEAARQFTELGVGNDAELAARFEKALAKFREGAARSGIAPEPARPAKPARAKKPKRKREERRGEPKPEATAASAATAPAEAAAAPAEASAPAKQPLSVEEIEKRLDQLCRDLEAVAGSDKLKTLNRALRRADKRIEEIGELPPPVIELAARADRARQAVLIRIGEVREQLEWLQWANVPKQEDLIKRAEALATDEEAGGLGDKLKKLQDEWKAVGPVPRDKAQELWDRFKAAADQIYARVKEERGQAAAERKENLKKKIELCERAEAVADSEDWAATAELLKGLQGEWKAIGPVPRRQSDKIWKRFRAACDRFFERRRPHLEEHLAEHREAIERKTQVVEAMEALVGADSDLGERLGEMRELQFQFRRAGRVPPREFHALRRRVEAAEKALEKERRQRADAEAAARIEAEKALAAAVDEAAEASGRGEAIAATLLELRGRFRDHGDGSEVLAAAQGRFDQLLLAALEAEPTAFAGTELDPEVSRQRREKLCARVEELVPEEESAAESPEEVAARLRAALADRALGGVLSKRADADTVKRVLREVRSSWARLAPVPGERGAALEERFRRACERAQRSAR